MRVYQAPRRNFHMVKIAFAVTAAAAVVMTVPLLVGTTSAKAQNLKMAQGVDVQLGRDRDDRDPGTADRRFTEQRGYNRRAAPFGLREGRPPERERPELLFAALHDDEC
jgi:hypothetical protein